MKRTLLTVLGLGLALSAPTALAQHAMPSDQVFVTKAGEGNLFEIDAARLALRMGNSEAVRAFAQKMITDHSKLGEDVKAALSGSDLKLPSTVSPAQQKQLNLLKASGPAFDATYKQMMVMSHYDTYTLFQSYIKVGHTPSLKAVIEKYTPVVKMHLDMARELPKK